MDGRTWKYGEITRKVLGSAIVVGRELGSGFLESVYEAALGIALTEAGLSFEKQKSLAVRFHEHEVGIFYSDFLVEGRIIVELKAARALVPEHQAQVIHYLKATGLEVGLLINFGVTPIEFKRLSRYIDVSKKETSTGIDG